MRATTGRNLIRGIILSSLATLMVAGFLVLGGLGGSDSAEAFRCSKKWFDRCPSITTTATLDNALPTSSR